MTAEIAHVLHTLLDPNLKLWASQIHAVALSLLVVAWFWPGIVAMFRHLGKHSATEIEWVTLWRCPECSTFNRRATLNCTHCEYHLEIGGLGKWIPLWFSEGIKRGGKRLVFLYSTVGWLMFYSLTGLMLFKLQLYTFRQNPVQEILASTALILLLITLTFFQLALRPRRKSPISAVMDLVAGFATCGVLTLSLLAWSQIPFQPQKPLGFVQTLSDTQIDIQKPGGRWVEVSTATQEIYVQYSVFSWPVLGLRELSLTRVAGKPLVSGWRIWLTEFLASPLQQPGTYRPRLTILGQKMILPVKQSLIIYEPQAGAGLALKKQ